MSKLIWDIDDGDFLHTAGDRFAYDSDGHMMMKMGSNMAMDMDSGDLHFIRGWDDDEDDW